MTNTCSALNPPAPCLPPSPFQPVDVANVVASTPDYVGMTWIFVIGLAAGLIAGFVITAARAYQEGYTSALEEQGKPQRPTPTDSQQAMDVMNTYGPLEVLPDDRSYVKVRRSTLLKMLTLAVYRGRERR